MKTYIPIAGSMLACVSLLVAAHCLPAPWGLPVAAAAGVALATGLTWAALREAQETIDRLLLLTPAEVALSILRPARVDFSQVCTAEEAAKEEAIRSAVSAVAESPDPR